MGNLKDVMIEKLFGVIQVKKEEIKKTEKPEWNTNCSFVSPLRPSQQARNLRVINDVSELVAMVADLLIIKDYLGKAYDTVGLGDDKPNLTWNNQTISDWIGDIKTRISIVTITKKKKELESLEKRLDKLVSKEKREEMELAAIQKELGI